MSRPIVYGARYYLPGRRISRFHLYRCEPDGSRRLQITDGKHNDASPAWSPDGTRIAFVRENRDVCLIDASGGPVRIVRKKAVEHGVWNLRWESGQLRAQIGETDTLIDARTGATRAVPAIDETRLTLPDGAQIVSKGYTTLQVTQKGATRTVTIHWDTDSLKYLASWNRTLSLALLPKSRTRIIVSYGAGESTFGHYESAWTVDLNSGAVADWGAHNGIHWSPDETRFCTTLTRDYPDFDTRPNGEARTVEVCPLWVARADAADRPVAIVKGFVFVDGCDWKPR